MTNTKKGPGMGKVVLGTAIGVGIGAAAVALSNKETRKTLTKKSAELKKDAEKTLTKGKEEMKSMQESLRAKADDLTTEQEAVKKTVKKQVAATKKSAAN